LLRSTVRTHYSCTAKRIIMIELDESEEAEPVFDLMQKINREL
jgi:hypothetical protein